MIRKRNHSPCVLCGTRRKIAPTMITYTNTLLFIHLHTTAIPTQMPYSKYSIIFLFLLLIKHITSLMMVCRHRPIQSHTEREYILLAEKKKNSTQNRKKVCSIVHILHKFLNIADGWPEWCARIVYMYWCRSELVLAVLSVWFLCSVTFVVVFVGEQGRIERIIQCVCLSLCILLCTTYFSAFFSIFRFYFLQFLCTAFPNTLHTMKKKEPIQT